MKNVLITGGAGFIGFHLAKKLLREGYTVDLLDNFNRGVLDEDLKKELKNKKLKLIKFNLIDNKIIDKLKSNYNFIFHLAAIVGVKNVVNQPFDVLDKNVIMTLNAIKIAKKQKKLNKFFYASTSEVYSKSYKIDNFRIPTPENIPLLLENLNEKRSTYFISKIYGECMVHQSKLPFVIFRPHNIFGPRMGMSHVIPELLKKFEKANRKIIVYSPHHTRSFCYINDAIDQLYLLTNNKNSLNKTYNIGNHKDEITIKKLSYLIKNYLKKKNVKIEFKSDDYNSPIRRCPSMREMNKLKKLTYINILDGISITYFWYKKNKLI